MPCESIKKLQIAIVGGGVCGLTCAIALAAKGLQADIYEASKEFGEIGAGLGLRENSAAILKELGALDDVLARGEAQGPEYARFRYGEGDDHALVYDHSIGAAEGTIGVHRAAFLDALVAHFDKSRAHFGKRCIAVTRSENDGSRSTIRFADGTSVDADIVIGADGLKSAVRAAVTGVDSAEHLTFSNTVAYRGLFPASKLKATGTKIDFTEAPINFIAKDRHVVTFPLKNATLINVVAFVTDRRVHVGEASTPPGTPQAVTATTQELLEKHADFGEDVQKLLGCIENPNKWNIYVVYPLLESYVSGRVALLGDSAHGMPPHLAAGAGQGLEDAHLLANLLGNPETTAENLEAVLKIYDEVRRARSQDVWKKSMRAGEIYEGRAEYGFSPQEMKDELFRLWDESGQHYDLQQDI